MKKKVLFSANLDSFFIKFLIPQLKYYKDKGYEVHVASKNEDIFIPYCDKKYNVCFSRSLNPKQILTSYKQMKEILKKEEYELISCHTPFGSAITRLAAKSVKLKKTKIVYMAHGFHFYEGAPLLNWLIFYPVEKYLSKYTDALITINKEDFEFASKKMKTQVYYIPGIGIEKEKFTLNFSEKDKLALRKKLKLKEDSYVMIFPGEINENKNQKLLIDTVKILKDKIKNICLLLPGNDLTNGEVEKYASDTGVENNVKFLGFRKDIPELLSISNISVSSSKREGLPVNLIEAMYMNNPIVATNCRGNRDLIEDNVNGFLVDNNSPEIFAEKILKIYNNDRIRDNFIKINKERVERYLVDNVLKEIIKVYEE